MNAHALNEIASTNPDGQTTQPTSGVAAAINSILPETTDVQDYVAKRLRVLAPKLPTLPSSHTALSVPTAFSDHLSEPHERALAWEALSAGVLKRLKPEERVVLVRGLMPYVAEDYPSNASGIVEMARNLSKILNGEIYRNLGENLLEVPLAQRDIMQLADPFLKILCPNLQFEPHLKPWTQLFATKGGAVTHLKLLNEMMQRLDQGHLSSYDHILQVILQSREKSVHAFLKTLIGPQETEPYRVTLLDFSANMIRNTLRVAPVTLIGSLLVGGLDCLATVTPYLVTAGISTLLTYSAMRSYLTEVSSQPSSHFSEAFYHFVGRIHQGLAAMNPKNENLSDLEQLIANNPSYAGRLKEWP